MTTDEQDPYAEVPPPRPTDGPQEPVDWRTLEHESHPEPPDGDNL